MPWVFEPVPVFGLFCCVHSGTVFSIVLWVFFRQKNLAQWPNCWSCRNKILPEVLLHLCTHPIKCKYCQFNVQNTHTYFIYQVYVSHNSPEKRSLLGIVVHAVGHQLSQLFAVWGGQLALCFIKPLLLLSKETYKSMMCIQTELMWLLICVSGQVVKKGRQIKRNGETEKARNSNHI